MTDNSSNISLNFLNKKARTVKFSRLDLSGNSGFLLVRQALVLMRLKQSQKSNKSIMLNR
jgi:hypothetical protein